MIVVSSTLTSPPVIAPSAEASALLFSSDIAISSNAGSAAGTLVGSGAAVGAGAAVGSGGVVGSGPVAISGAISKARDTETPGAAGPTPAAVTALTLIE